MLIEWNVEFGLNKFKFLFTKRDRESMYCE